MRFIRHPAFRWLITFILLGLLGYQLWSRSDHFRTLNLDIFSKTGWWLVLVIVLMPINWWLETLKWRTYLSVHVRVPMRSMLKAVAGGVVLSLFTPNRIGEYGGRILFMPSNARWPVAISTLMGSLSQNLIGFTVGIISCIFLFEGLILLKIFGIILVLIAVLCFFRIKQVLYRISALKIHSVFRKLVLNLHYIDDYSTPVLVRALCIALGRYIVYTLQFLLLLHAFEPAVQPGILFLGISSIYLFQTLIPLPPVADVIARTNIGLILWSGAGMNELSISLASLMVWLVNLFIPALIGSLLIGTTGHENSLDTHDPITSSVYKPFLAEPSAND